MRVASVSLIASCLAPFRRCIAGGGYLFRAVETAYTKKKKIGQEGGSSDFECMISGSLRYAIRLRQRSRLRVANGCAREGSEWRRERNFRPLEANHSLTDGRPCAFHPWRQTSKIVQTDVLVRPTYSAPAFWPSERVTPVCRWIVTFGTAAIFYSTWQLLIKSKLNFVRKRYI